ncbi:DUF4376 domain-containing protein [Phascolarctobacterium succinatutens]|uniref:DUF4376 domain-containing protein n=1 Tax=Phascolarctobacterium succinatutens TaxID=626940 RepID=UPI00206834A7|nr:MAG TPA: protein of unknown function (DUF4376) [Caudoviricetes sp.]
MNIANIKLPEEWQLDLYKKGKISKLKNDRDNKEVEPIEYNGFLYDYDSKARERINAAIIALDDMGAGSRINWTSYNNYDVLVTAKDLRKIIANVAIRSNKLHTAYRLAKEKIEQATTKEEVDKITLEL